MLLHRIAGIRTWVRIYTPHIVAEKFCSGIPAQFHLSGTLNEIPDIHLQSSFVVSLTVNMDIIVNKKRLFMLGGLPDVVSGMRFLMALLVRRAMGSSCLPLCVDFSNTGDWLLELETSSTSKGHKEFI
ncbi:unnamed protein product, partial [Onchocerca ochengi]|uniref:Secreted protein n=1 Tax=Onchocerca ochengi TaxID=42157 RepID=A0A182EZ03_ONCOC